MPSTTTPTGAPARPADGGAAPRTGSAPVPPAPPAPPRSGSGSRRHITLALVALALVLLGVGGVIWFLGGSAPEAVDITAATADLEDTTTSDTAAEDNTAEDTSAATAADTTASAGTSAATGTSAETDTATAATSTTGIAGTWAVDTSIGTFSIADTTGTFVGFRVAEELASIGATEAVGRTPAVSGSVTIEGTTLTAASIEADLTQIVSDESRREDSIQRALGTSANPTATFTLTQPVELGEAAATGEVVTVTATGTLTVNGVTQEVTVPLSAQLTGDVVTVTGSFDITFADYGVSAPSAPIVISVADTGTVELQLYLTQG